MLNKGRLTLEGGSILAAYPLGIGPMEALILLGCCGSMAVIVVVVVLAVRKSKSGAALPPAAPMKRCAVCGQQYAADYDGCPHCARTQSAPTGTESP